MAVPAPVHPRDRPIAVFDSGVGGLTVLHELLVQLPEEDFVYLADTARFPYGDRTRAELERFSLEIAEELLRHRAKLLVVACNSATAAALPALNWGVSLSSQYLADEVVRQPLPSGAGCNGRTNPAGSVTRPRRRSTNRTRASGWSSWSASAGSMSMAGGSPSGSRASRHTWSIGSSNAEMT